LANQLLTEIDKWICDIWKNEISKEYNSNKIAQESVLHSSFYFHLRTKIESIKTHDQLLVYFNMPFKDNMVKKYHNYPSVDLAVIMLKKDEWYPKELLSVIELKHYDYHSNSAGINKDLDHLEALRKGIYYPYKPTRRLSSCLQIRRCDVILEQSIG